MRGTPWMPVEVEAPSPGTLDLSHMPSTLALSGLDLHPFQHLTSWLSSTWPALPVVVGEVQRRGLMKRQPLLLCNCLLSLL